MSADHVWFGPSGRKSRSTRSGATLTPGSRTVVRRRLRGRSPPAVLGDRQHHQPARPPRGYPSRASFAEASSPGDPSKSVAPARREAAPPRPVLAPRGTTDGKRHAAGPVCVRRTGTTSAPVQAPDRARPFPDPCRSPPGLPCSGRKRVAPRLPLSRGSRESGGTLRERPGRAPSPSLSAGELRCG